MRQTVSETSEETPQITFGADVTMTKTRGQITLHAPGGSGCRVIGTYASTAAAWEALDAIDAPLDVDAAHHAA